MRRTSVLLLLGAVALNVCVNAHSYAKIENGYHAGQGFTSKHSSSISSSSSFSAAAGRRIAVNSLSNDQAYADVRNVANAAAINGAAFGYDQSSEKLASNPGQTTTYWWMTNNSPFVQTQGAYSANGASYAGGSASGSSSGGTLTSDHHAEPMDVSGNPFLNGVGFSAGSSSSHGSGSYNSGNRGSAVAASGFKLSGSSSDSNSDSDFAQQATQISGGSGNPFFQQTSEDQESVFGQRETVGFSGLSGNGQNNRESISGFETGLSLSCKGQGNVCIAKHLCSAEGYFVGKDFSQVRSGQQSCNVDTEVCCVLKRSSSSETQIGTGSGHSTITTSFGTKFEQSAQNNGGIFGSSSGNSDQIDLNAGEGLFSDKNLAQDNNGYLPPIGFQPSDNVPAFVKPPGPDQPSEKADNEDPSSTNNRPTAIPPPADTPRPHVGCAAALVCVEEQFCTLEGSISPTPVVLSSEQILRRAPITSCQNPDSGIIGKCCRDPNYVDPWPTANLPANYSGGFDEQGFPTFLNIAKTRPTKKPGNKNGKPINNNFPNSIGVPSPPRTPITPQFPNNPNPIPNQISSHPSKHGFANRPNQPNRPTGIPSRPNQPSRPVVPSRPSQPIPAGFPDLPTKPSPSGFPNLPSQPTPTSFPNLPSQPAPTGFPNLPSQPTPTGSPNLPSQPIAVNFPDFSKHPSPIGFSDRPSQPTPTSFPNFPSQPAPTTFPNHPSQPSPTGFPNRPSQPSPITFPNRPSQPSPASFPDFSRQPNPTSSPNRPNQPSPTGFQITVPNQPSPVGFPELPAQPIPDASLEFSSQPSQPIIPEYSGQQSQPGVVNVPSRPIKPSFPTLPSQPSVNSFPSGPRQPTKGGSHSVSRQPTKGGFLSPPRQPSQPGFVDRTTQPGQPGYTDYSGQQIQSGFVGYPNGPNQATYSNVKETSYHKTNYDGSSSNQNPTIIQTYTPGSQCGVRHNVHRPDGLTDVDVGFGEIPWQAMILLTTEKRLLCSGAIIAPNAIATSARCVEGHNPSNIAVKTGEWKLGYELINEEPLPFEITNVVSIVSHPQHNPESFSHDVAILFLEHEVKVDQHVDMLCLPQNQPQLPQIGKKCISTGWGKAIIQLHAAGALMHSIDVDVLSNEQCRQRVAGAESQIDIDDSLICGKAHRTNNNMCQVDIGGPLACDRGDGNYELVGIYNQDTGCSPTNQVATFAKIDTLWMQETLSLAFQGYASVSVPRPSFTETVENHRAEKPCDCQESHLPAGNNQYLPPH